MFSLSQSDGNTGFSGGGFMPSQSTQTFDTSPSLSKSRDFQGLVPVTVKQISEASPTSDEKPGFVINGVEVTNVTLLGMVFGKDDKSFTEVSFFLDDGTGRIGCRRWTNDPFDSKEMEIIQDGMYVRLNGNLKSFLGKKQLVTFSVRPVTDFNEVTFHYTDCIYFYWQRSKSQPAGSAAQGDSTLNTHQRGGSTGYLAAPSSQGPVRDGQKNWDELILDYLKQPSSIERQQGVHIEEISGHLKIPINKIEDCIHSLESDGLIYSTIDQYHFKHVES